MSSKIFKNDEYIDFIIKERFLEPEQFIDYKGTCVPKNYLKYSELVENFEVRDDDIWLCHFPRSGIYNINLFVLIELRIEIVIYY